MEHDWSASDRQLYSASIEAIDRFGCEHPNDEVCCFFFDCDDPRYGRLFISFDSIENNIRCAKELEQFAIESRQENLQGRLSWECAKFQLTSPVLSPFNTNSGDFAYREFADVDFPTWVTLAENEEYPNDSEDNDDYLESNARLVMWRVAEQLVTDKAFSSLNLASPFIVGYCIHDQEEVILRLLNWPKGS